MLRHKHKVGKAITVQVRSWFIEEVSDKLISKHSINLIMIQVLFK